MSLIDCSDSIVTKPFHVKSLCSVRGRLGAITALWFVVLFDEENSPQLLKVHRMFFHMVCFFLRKQPFLHFTLHYSLPTLILLCNVAKLPR